MTHSKQWKVGRLVGIFALGTLVNAPTQDAHAQPNPDRVRAEQEARDAQARAEMHRYNRLDEILGDLDLILNRANNSQHALFEKQIDAAIAAWPEIAEQFPNEATEYEPLRHDYVKAYQWIRIDEYEKASEFLRDARRLRQEMAEKGIREQQDRRERQAAGEKLPPREGDYDNPVVALPPNGKPFELKGRFYGAGSEVYGGPVMVVPGRAKLEIPYNAATKMMQAGASERGVPWEPWRARMFDLVCSLWSQNLAVHRKNKGVLRYKIPCATVAYTIKHDTYAGIYRVENIRLVASSGNLEYDWEAQDAVHKLDNWGGQPQMRFPRGTRKLEMTLQTNFTIGKRTYTPTNDIERVPGNTRR